MIGLICSTYLDCVIPSTRQEHMVVPRGVLYSKHAAHVSVHDEMRWAVRMCIQCHKGRGGEWYPENRGSRKILARSRFGSEIAWVSGSDFQTRVSASLGFYHSPPLKGKGNTGTQRASLILSSKVHICFSFLLVFMEVDRHHVTQSPVSITYPRITAVLSRM